MLFRSETPYAPLSVVENPSIEELKSKRVWYIGGGVAAAMIVGVILLNRPKIEPPVVKPQTETTPSVSEPQKPVSDKQKFETLMQDADGALTAGDKEEAQKNINAAKQILPNDSRIAEFEQRLKKMK